MSPLKLHHKTTLLTSAITVAVLILSGFISSSHTAELLRNEQRARAELQASFLASQISQLPYPRDPQILERAVLLMQNARPGVNAVRIWERVGAVYVKVAAAGEAPSENIPEETITLLRSGLPSRTVQQRPEGTHASLYRVFAPVFTGSRLSGAVELIELLDDTPSIAAQSQRMSIWIALVAVLVITLGTFTLFDRLIYRPIGQLLKAMNEVEAGNLAVEITGTSSDELGILTRNFNGMIQRVRTMTEEREAQKLLLQEQVNEATQELSERNQQLESANRELWQLSRRLSEMERLAVAGQTAAQFAHEVGTPLNLISGHVQLLQNNLKQDPKALSRLETINIQIERIERIVRSMLDRTRSEATPFAPVDLETLLNRIIDVITPTLHQRDIHMVTEFAASLPLINGNADRLQQVFFNLINNAMDAMAAGGSLTIKTECKASDCGEPLQVIVSVVDTGCGMTDEVRARIFDPLYTTKEKGRGTGLGLVVVHQIMRDHHGQIDVESTPGQGTCFRLSFPI